MNFALGVLPLLLLAAGLPIFLVLLASATLALVFFTNTPPSIIHQTLFGTLNNVALLAIPFFIYAGELMGRGTVAQRLVDVVQSTVGVSRGSLAVTTVGTSAIFGAITGVSAACVATVGKIMYPAMRKEGYPSPFSAGLVTAVGAIDIIIPPSIPMIVYGSVASQSVPRLYAAGIAPGLLLAAMLAAYVVARAWWGGFGEGKRFRLGVTATALRRGAWALGMPFIVLGGIYGGVFSPTEAAAVASVYAIFVTTVIFRELSPLQVLEAAASTIIFSAQIMIVVACASVFSWVLTTNGVPAAIVGWLQELAIPGWMLLLMMNLLLLVIGCFIDPLSAILLLTPLLLPIAQSAGVDGVHFGIILTVNLAIGMFSPPFGMNIFVAQSVLGIPLKDIYLGLIPYVIIYIVCLMLITYIPAIANLGIGLFF